MSVYTNEREAIALLDVEQSRRELDRDHPIRLMQLLRAWLYALEELFAFVEGRDPVPYWGPWTPKN